MQTHKTEHDEISEVARELWRTRGHQAHSPEEDWYEAERIVRERRRMSSTDSAIAGNSTPLGESYTTGASHAHTGNQSDWKESTGNMENTMTNRGPGTAETTGPQKAPIGGSFEGATEAMHNASDRMSGMVQSATERVQNVAHDVMNRAGSMMHRAGNVMEREPRSMPRTEHREGPIARGIEQQTAKIPSDAFLWAAVGSIGLSLALELSGREKTASFVGHWAPTLLILGMYNKMVKLHGSDGV